jgi:UPF0716 protein FxsA
MPFLFLLILPALEIYLFIKIGAQIGALAVIVWLIGAVILGTNILRYLGASAMLGAARKMQTGEAPAQALADTMMKALAAVLLIIPGFATDLIAMLLFIPPIRHLLLRRWLSKLFRKASLGSVNFGGKGFGENSFGGAGFGSSGNVYEHKGSTTPPGDAPSSGHILEHETKKNE